MSGKSQSDIPQAHHVPVGGLTQKLPRVGPTGKISRLGLSRKFFLWGKGKPRALGAGTRKHRDLQKSAPQLRGIVRVTKKSPHPEAKKTIKKKRATNHRQNGEKKKSPEQKTNLAWEAAQYGKTK